MFKQATKTKAKLRLALAGATGSGKTYSSMLLARKLGERVAVIDSERGSASLYADRFKFDVADLPDHSIETYRRAIKAAADAKYDVLIIDSLSHEWMGKGGALETVDRLGGDNKFTNGWRAVTPMHTSFLDDVLAYPGHVIATLRKKMEYAMVQNSKGKVEPKKVGLAPVQRDGVEYEFSVVLDLETDGALTVAKTRCSALDDIKATLRREDIEKVGDLLAKWISDGAEPAPAPTPKPTPSNGAPRNAMDALAVKIGEAQSAGDLDALVPTIKTLSPIEQAKLRDAFGRRKMELERAS
jgi:hypothetical protein